MQTHNNSEEHFEKCSNVIRRLEFGLTEAKMNKGSLCCRCHQFCTSLQKLILEVGLVHRILHQWIAFLWVPYYLLHNSPVTSGGFNLPGVP